jgi:uncharacterized membrane protein YfcA
MPKVLGYGLGTGAFSGFFEIGGGFLIVPGLIASTGMPMINAVGTSLVAVTAFGLTTAYNYALSGLVDLAARGAVHWRRDPRQPGRHQGGEAAFGRRTPD